MNATEFDELAHLTLVEFARARLRFEDDLAQALVGPESAGIPPRLQEAARTGTLIRTMIGERTGKNVRARAYRVTLSAAQENPPPEYLHVICVNDEDAISYINAHPLIAGISPTNWRFHFWNLDYSIVAKLRWYGFAQKYGISKSANFEIRRERWDGWSKKERSVAVKRIRRLTQETNLVVMGKDRPLPLIIGAIDNTDEPPNTIVYRGRA